MPIMLAGLAALLAACGSGAQPSSPAPSAAQSAAPAGTPAPPAPPYRFGEVQATAPPTVGGEAPVVRRIPTDKRYVYVTIDDGEIKFPGALAMIERSGAHPTLFLTQKYVSGHADYFRAIRDQTGADIEDHTMTHANLRHRPYAVQRQEICADADAETAEFGRRPTLFRPPYGNYDTNTQKAAADCGMRAVVLWTAAVNNGVVQFQHGDHLNPGDIVLMHFRTTFAEDYQALVDRARRDNLIPVPLPDFLG